MSSFEASESKHKRHVSLLRLSVEPELTYVNKAGWLFKIGKLKRNWLRRWYSVNSERGSFRYCSRPGPALDQGQLVLSGRVVGAVPIEQPCFRASTLLHGFSVVDSTGMSKSFFCDSLAQRDAWVWYLSRVAHSKVYVRDRYKVDWHQVIGSGAYADVVRGWDNQSEEAVALKVVSRPACQRYFDLMNKEVAVMHVIGEHPHLLTLREVFYSNHHIYIITDFLAGGELYHQVVPLGGGTRTPFSEDEASSIIRQLCSALAHLHAKGVAHCDVKPENILFTSRHEGAPLKLIDYNSAVFFNEPTEPGGTPEYMAPELITCHEDLSRTGWGPEPDMWALGILTYWLLCGHTPFTASNIPRVLHNVETCCFRWPRGVQLSDSVKGLIQSLLKRRPEERPSAAQVLRHPWVSGALFSRRGSRRGSFVSRRCSLTSATSSEGAAAADAKVSGLPSLATRGDSPLVRNLMTGDPKTARDSLSMMLLQQEPCSETGDLQTLALGSFPSAEMLPTWSLPMKLSIKVAPPSSAESAPAAEMTTSEAITDASPNLFLEAGSTVQLVAYNDENPEPKPGSHGDPLDSCMSLHDERCHSLEDDSSTKTASAENPLEPATPLQGKRARQPHRLQQLTTVTSCGTYSSSSSKAMADARPSNRQDTDRSSREGLAWCPFHSPSSADLSLSGEESSGSERCQVVPLMDRLPAPDEHLSFHDLHQVMVRKKALRALVKAQRQNQLPSIVLSARQSLQKTRSV